MSGELISTNEDTAAFITALLDGRVVPPAQLSQMMEPSNNLTMGQASVTASAWPASTSPAA